MRRFLPKPGLTPQNIKLTFVPFGALAFVTALLAALQVHWLIIVVLLTVLFVERLVITLVIAQTVEQMFNPSPEVIDAAMQMVNSLFNNPQMKRPE